MDSPAQKRRDRDRDRERRKKQKNPIQFAWKWNLYLFASCWKNGSDFKSVTKGVIYFLHFITALFPSLYTILEYLDRDMSREDGIFPASRVLSFVTPQILPTSAFVLIMFVWLLIFIVVLLVCLISSRKSFKYIRILGRTHILDVRIHMVIIPIATGVLRYHIGVLGEWNVENLGNIIIAMSYFIIFAVYIGGCCILHLIETMSLAKPDTLYEGWFEVRDGVLPPAVLVITSLMGFGALHWGKIDAIIALSVGCIICLSICIYVILTVPKMMFLTNDLVATQYATSAYGFVMSLVMILLEPEYGSPILYTVPVVAVILFILIYVISQTLRRRRRKLYLAQIENDTEHMTVDTLTETLKTVKNIGDFKLIIKEGLVSGCKAVRQPLFLRYCLEKFSDSEWMLCYTMFLYGTVWGADSEAYKLMLHLISIDEFGFNVEFLIFQLVFNLMQTSATLSPVIDRNLNFYHEDMKEYLEAHRSFWYSAVRQNEKDFEKSFAQMVDSFIAMEKRLTSLTIAFQYSPIIHCERSIFFSDFCHDIEKGSEAYNKTMALFNAKQNSVSISLAFEFSRFFHVPRPQNWEIKDEGQNNYYCYFTITDHDYDGSTKNPEESGFSSDKFLGRPREFRLRKNRPRTSPVVARTQIEILRVMPLISVLLFIACFIAEHFITGPLLRSYNKYVMLRDAVSTTLEFKSHMTKVRVNFAVLYNIITGTWDDPESTDAFYGYIRTHLVRSTPYINNFTNMVDRLREEGIEMPVEDKCTSSVCTFTSSVAMMSWVCDYFGRVNAKSQIGGEPVTTLESVDLMYNYVMKYTTTYYNVLCEKIYANIEAEIDSRKKMTISIVCVELFLAIVTSWVTAFLVEHIKTVIFNIIKTAQPPIMLYISRFYNQVIGNDDEKSNIDSRKLPNASIWFFFMFMVLLIYPLGFMVWGFTAPDISRNRVIPPDFLIDNKTDFMIYKLSQIEYTLTSEKKYMNNATGISCYHEILETNYSGGEIAYASYDNTIFGLLYLGQVIIMLTAGSFCVVAILKSFQVKTMLSVGTYLLRYFPRSEVQSNPLFKKLLLGESPTAEETREFTENINEGVEQLIDDLDCYELFFDETGAITSENIDKILGSTPKDLQELKGILTRHCQTSYKAKVETFIDQAKQGVQGSDNGITMSMDNKKEITISYGCDRKSIIITDDTNYCQDNEMNNAELCERLEERIKEIEDRDKADPYTKAALVLIDYSKAPEGTCQRLIQAKETFKNLAVVDTRQQFLVVIGNASALPGLICKEAIEYAQSIPDKSFVRCVVHFGGPLAFFKSTDITKDQPRCYGAAYDDMKFLLSRVPYGTIAATKIAMEQAVIAPEKEEQLVDGVAFVSLI